MSENYPIVEISKQPIELCKLLKIANMVSGGGEAKIVISEGYVLLNDEVEYQKRKKVYDKDVVSFNGEIVEVFYNPASNTSGQKKATPAASPIKAQTKGKRQTKNNPNIKYQDNIANESLVKTTPAKRKPISF